MEEVVVIVGAGPSGLATAACLTKHSIPYIILEKEDCSGSLWKKRAYDRLSLHLGKCFCELPFAKYPSSYPTFLSKKIFVEYLDTYVSNFNINPLFYRHVQSASYNEIEMKWTIKAKNILSNEIEVYVAEFLVVATGENNKGFIPDLPGLKSFRGEIIHSNEYKSGMRYKDKDVLVVGCGNSGMEISYDLASSGAHTSIVIRSPFHVLTRRMVYLGMRLLNHFKMSIVDTLIVWLARIYYGDLSKFGIYRPTTGPFYFKVLTGKTPVIDVGTVQKIKDGNIKVFPEIENVSGNKVLFKNGEEKTFEVILFATGYKSAANTWLKDHHYILNHAGMPKNKVPMHWKGENGIYCAGLSRMGLAGISSDAKMIADDIAKVIQAKNKKVI